MFGYPLLFTDVANSGAGSSSSSISSSSSFSSSASSFCPCKFVTFYWRKCKSSNVKHDAKILHKVKDFINWNDFKLLIEGTNLYCTVYTYLFKINELSKFIFLKFANDKEASCHVNWTFLLKKTLVFFWHANNFVRIRCFLIYASCVKKYSRRIPISPAFVNDVIGGKQIFGDTILTLSFKWKMYKWFKMQLLG